MKRKSYDFQKAGTIWHSKCHVYVDSGSAWLELPLLIILANFARIIALKNHPKLGWILKDMSGQLCRKLRQSQPEKSGQVGQAFLQQLPLKLSGSERDNYSQLGNNFKTATSRQLVGKWAMTVLKMRPKLGHIFPKAVQMVTKRPVYRLVTMMVTVSRMKDHQNCSHDGNNYRQQLLFNMNRS